MNMARRDFLRYGLAGGAALTGCGSSFASQQAARPKARGVIWIWLGGGSSQIDTFDPKPGTKFGGEFGAIETSVAGVQFCELLPACAAQMKHMAIVRSMSTGEGSHERGTYLMHTGFPPVPGVEYPSIGTVVAHELGKPDFELPRFIAMDPPKLPLGPVFGEECLPFRLRNADDPIPNLRSGAEGCRERERLALLAEQSAEWEKEHGGEEAARLALAGRQAEKLMSAPALKAFDWREEPEALRSEYGGRFGISCLLARRLVEAGCPFVEIGLGGWDIHGDMFGACRRALPTLDRGLGTLVKDLAGRGMLKDTLVVCASEFGRTPSLNAGKGRDTWANGFSVVLAGAGLKRGCVYGSTGPEGTECIDPVTPARLFTTIYTALGIDPNRKFGVSPEPSRDTYTWPRSEPIRELLAI